MTGKQSSFVLPIIANGEVIGATVAEVDQDNSGLSGEECPRCGNIILETENFCPVCYYNKSDVG